MDATQYLEHWKRRRVWTHLKHPKHQQRLKRCAELVRGSTFLDVGCAFGHSTVIMAGFRPGRWAGLDYAVEAIMKASDGFPEFDWHYARSHDYLGSLGGHFDSVVCSEVIEHMPDPEAFVNAIIQIPKHRAVFTTPDRKVSDPGHLRLYTEETLKVLFKGKNFQILHEPPFFYIVVSRNEHA